MCIVSVCVCVVPACVQNLCMFVWYLLLCLESVSVQYLCVCLQHVCVSYLYVCTISVQYLCMHSIIVSVLVYFAQQHQVQTVQEPTQIINSPLLYVSILDFHPSRDIYTRWDSFSQLVNKTIVKAPVHFYPFHTTFAVYYFYKVATIMNFLWFCNSSDFEYTMWYWTI